MAIATATATYPDNKQIDLRDTLCTALGYPVNVDDGQGGIMPNPETKAQFLQRKFNDHFKAWLKNTYVTQKERESLAANAITNSIEIV